MADRNQELSERKKLILKAVIDAHIKNGEPVGSKTLTRHELISCSSATIRNEMAELENLGYLEQPHTSAGRIPSEAGYRFYVDWLLDRYNLTNAEIDELRTNLSQKQAELDSIMETAVKLAAKLTNYTALSVKPKILRITVSRYEIMRIDDYTCMLIMLIGSMVKTKYMHSDAPIPQQAAAQLSSVLNMTATGITASEFNMPLIMKMEGAMGEYDYMVTPVVKAICQAMSEFDGSDLKFEGVNRLLSYPEFYDVDRLREILALFEKKDALLDVLSDTNGSDDGLKILIGRENVVKVMDNSTLIFKSIIQNGTPVGAIGIIGPTRMDYRRVIATVDSLAKGVSAALDSGRGPKKISGSGPGGKDG